MCTPMCMCVYVCTCVCVRDSSISRQPHLSIFMKAGSGHPFLLSYTEAERKTVQWLITHSSTCRDPERMNKLPWMTSEGQRVMAFSLKKTACCCWGWQLITNHITIKYLNLYWPETHWIMILNSLLLLLSVSVQVGKQLLVSQARVQKYFVWPQGISNDFIDPLSFMFLCCGQNH